MGQLSFFQQLLLESLGRDVGSRREGLLLPTQDEWKIAVYQALSGVASKEAIQSLNSPDHALFFKLIWLQTAADEDLVESDAVGNYIHSCFRSLLTVLLRQPRFCCFTWTSTLDGGDGCFSWVRNQLGAEFCRLLRDDRFDDRPDLLKRVVG